MFKYLRKKSRKISIQHRDQMEPVNELEGAETEESSVSKMLALKAQGPEFNSPKSTFKRSRPRWHILVILILREQGQEGPWGSLVSYTPDCLASTGIRIETHKSTHTHTHTHTHIHKCTHTHTQMHTHIQPTGTYMHTHTNIHIYNSHMHAHTYTHNVHAHSYTCTHTYTHTHMHTKNMADISLNMSTKTNGQLYAVMSHAKEKIPSQLIIGMNNKEIESKIMGINRLKSEIKACSLTSDKEYLRAKEIARDKRGMTENHQEHNTYQFHQPTASNTHL